ncbi:tRNA methyl transferase [Martensiomyces pterosporus]|nr:tRNA methyl transferase [Martensiomyces pterosporus]
MYGMASVACLGGARRWTLAAPRSVFRRHTHHLRDTWDSEVKRGDKVYVGMSGGVDSSVTAHLLKERGVDVEAVFMRNWDTRDERGECPSERDWRDVQRVCRQLDIKCHEINLVKEYWTMVFSAALDEYSKGRTPNPDVLCNKEIKFGVLLKEIRRRLHGSPKSWFATGHYARSIRDPDTGKVGLYRGMDERKDQSYYLAAVSSGSLDKVAFPLGALNKERDVRRIASDAGLATAQKEESMGICFVGERRRFDEFLAEYLPQREGDILSSDGLRLGRHKGMFTKTIGQSAGISGWQDKWYIYAKDIHSNRMHAVQNRKHPLLYARNLSAGPVHWISGTPPEFGDRNKLMLEAQIRYMQRPQTCMVSSKCGQVHVEFAEDQFGVAAGQYLVLYRGDQCLGSAVILGTR